MSLKPISVPADLVELLDDAALSLQQLARACAMPPEWVHTHVEAGVLQRCAAAWLPSGVSPAPRAARAPHRRAGAPYDADPQLAALAADLMEEVAWLRRQLARLDQD